jgi:large subunit ribosomal protein L24
MARIVKGDTVVVRRGKEKGKRGTVKHVFPKEGKATVEGLNVVKRHTKQGMGGAKAAGIFEKEAPLPLCALMVVDPKTNLPTRVRRVRKADGSMVRVAVRSGEELLVSAKGR